MVVLSEILQESSSSSSTRDHRYDVFLSFRGADTRNSFTDHLYNALKDANLEIFLDDEEIETGEELKPELEIAIKASRAYIIVLSKNYASSTWCLDELVLILEQHKIVIPIFYHVEPTDVRKQQSSFGDAMTKHKQRMEEETNAEKRSQLGQKMELWKKALSQVADLKGKDAKDRKETELIEEIVSDIHHRLGATLISNSLPLLIGMDHNIKFITSWLTDGSCHTADLLTILGMGGIGKTSLAKYVYWLHCHKYQKSSFLEGIGIRCNQQFNGLLDLQKQLYGDISRKNLLQVHDVSVYTAKIENVLARKKVFLVLDDIDSLEQLYALLGNKGFHPGSKIIITTKYDSLTESYALFNPQVQPKHKKVCPEGLYEIAALELLCIHAFKCQKPKEGYEEVSKKLVRYCEGHPLALKVLGESLHNRDLAYWEACTEGLKKGPHSRIQEVLHMSFNSLPFKNDKDLFKHIACFFIGVDRDVIETILDACDLNTRSGITNLIDRCLLTVSRNNELMMHQLIQEMGRDLVRQESPNKPWKRSRLWCHEESFEVLKKKKGKDNILGLALDMRMLDKKKIRGSSGLVELKTDSLSQMDNLILLQLSYVQMYGSFENFPQELRWLCMHGFSLKSIPSDLPMENLVALDLSYSNIESFGMRYSNPQPLIKQKQLLGSLKILDLSFCLQLHSLLGFFELPALERLIVKNCISLLEVCESIEHCVELVLLDLSYCYKLKKLPISISKLKKVKTLILDGCNFLESRIEVRDMDSPNMTVADIGMNPETPVFAVMEDIPRDLKFLAIYLPCSLVSLSLKDSKLSGESFPYDLSSLSMLKDLYLDGNPIVTMPDCVRSLSRLETLSMANCKMLISIERPPRTLRKLILEVYSISIRKIVFDPEMSPLSYFGDFLESSPCSSFEVDGMIKIQPMESVDERVLRSLGWTNLEFAEKGHVETYNIFRGVDVSQTQMYYEFGIFSTFYEGEEMPNWIVDRSEGPSIAFTIPSSPKKLRGLNFCCVDTLLSDTTCHVLPMIKISNITKGHTWIYCHYIFDQVSVGGMCLIYLSHWMFGKNEMESGDQVLVNVIHNAYGFYYDDDDDAQITSMCGVRLVYDERKMELEAEEEDALCYYKSWNHIIGGDLSAFQTVTGEYILKIGQFMRHKRSPDSLVIEDSASYKEDEVPFKAFSQRKPGILDHASRSEKVLLKDRFCRLERSNTL